MSRRHDSHDQHHSIGDTDDEGIEKDHDDGEDEFIEDIVDQQSPKKSASAATVQKRTATATTRNNTSSANQVLALCAHHLSVNSEADAHFRAVCRALVSEVIELSTFLEKARAASGDNEELQELALHDWVGNMCAPY